jgi:hypothetical protein
MLETFAEFLTEANEENEGSRSSGLKPEGHREMEILSVV